MWPRGSHDQSVVCSQIKRCVFGTLRTTLLLPDSGFMAYLHCQTQTRIQVRISIPKMGNWHGSGSVLESESEFVQRETISVQYNAAKKCVTPEPVLEPRFLSQAIFENLSENPG